MKSLLNLFPLKERTHPQKRVWGISGGLLLLLLSLTLTVSVKAEPIATVDVNIGEYMGKYNAAHDAFQVQLIEENEFYYFIFTFGGITELEPGRTYTLADCLSDDVHDATYYSFAVWIGNGNEILDYDNFSLTYNRDAETGEESFEGYVEDIYGFAYKLRYTGAEPTPPTPSTPGESYYIRLDGTDLYFSTNEVADNANVTYSLSSEKEAFVVTSSGDGFTIQSADNGKYAGHGHTNSWDFSDNADVWYIQSFEEPTSILKDGSKGFGVDDQYDGAGVYTDKSGQLWVFEPVNTDGIAAPVATSCTPVKRLTRRGTLLSHPTGVYDLGGRFIKR